LNATLVSATWVFIGQLLRCSKFSPVIFEHLTGARAFCGAAPREAQHERADDACLSNFAKQDVGGCLTPEYSRF
jgi:hypothetical protein